MHDDFLGLVPLFCLLDQDIEGCFSLRYHIIEIAFVLRLHLRQEEKGVHVFT